MIFVAKKLLGRSHIRFGKRWSSSNTTEIFRGIAP